MKGREQHVVAVAGNIFRVESVTDNSQARTHEVFAKFLASPLADKITHAINCNILPKVEMGVPFYGTNG